MNPKPHRAFERVLSLPSKPRVGPAAAVPGSDKYGILAKVSIEHTYYNASAGRCPDFMADPTPATAARMKKIGLLFRNDETGFYILYDRSRTDQLVDYLRRTAGFEAWPRLSFVLWTGNPFFVSFSEIPIATDPMKSNFYFSNRTAHPGEPVGTVLLNPGRFVRGDQLVKVIGTQYPVTVDLRINRVVVRDIANEIVNCQPRCVPVPLARLITPEWVSCARLDEFLTLNPYPVEEVCRDVIYLDFSGLPEGEYTVEKVDAAGIPVEAADLVLYTSMAPIPLCFIDLLFTKPGGIRKGKKEGVYPVVGLNTKNPRVTPVTYTLRFQSRRTHWNYFIVPAAESRPLRDPRIEDLSGTGVTFLGPCRVELANGQTAYRFTSKQTIPLRQRSEFRFQLLCGRSGTTEEKILVKRLPVASAKQVLPLTPAGACRKLTASLLPESAAEPGCQSLIRNLCSPAERKKAGPAVSSPDTGLETTTYSDIYVYV